MEEALINKLSMKINTNKSKVLVYSINGYTGIKIYLEKNHEIVQVGNFSYLGSIISVDERSKKETFSRSILKECSR